MKLLLYKEFKLCWHPLVFVFLFLFPLFVLIPNYPVFIGLMLIILNFTFLFIGVNKGKQTNDLLYTITLPVSKKQIVIARAINMIIMEMIACIIVGAMSPVAEIIREAIGGKPLGIDFNSIGVTIGFSLIAYSFVNALYLIMFYKNGRSVLAPTLLSFIVFLVFMSIMTMILPLTIESYNLFFCDIIWTQFIVLIICLLLYFLVNFIAIKKASKNIQNINL